MYNKIAINGRFFSRRITGVERYAIEIIKELDGFVEKGNYVLVIPDDATVPFKLSNIDVVKVKLFKNRLWEHLTFGVYCYIHKYLPFNFCNVGSLLNPGVVVMHDVKVLAHPEFFNAKFRLWYKLLFRNQSNRCKHIFTVSNFSKKEIVRYLNVNEKIIDVAYSSWQHFRHIKIDECALAKFHLEEKKFMFSMSSMEPNKNFRWIAEIAKKNSDKIFVIAGAINNTVFEDGLGFDVPDNMKLLGYITDEEAKMLMKSCDGFLFPTIYEGFGLPPLEAMSAGCTRIYVSNNEVMHEVYGEYANYIDPYVYEIKFDYEDNNVFELLDKYSWECSARNMHSVLLSILK